MGWSGPVTNRQFNTWTFWLGEQWNLPSRTDNYLMQIACEVRRVLSRRPRSIKMKDFKLEFGDSKGKAKQQSLAYRTMAAKAKWIGIVSSVGSKGKKGAKVTKKPAPRPGQPVAGTSNKVNQMPVPKLKYPPE